MSMRTDDFDYNLPEELIAQAPAEPRDSCRLLVVDRKGSEAGTPLEHGGTVEHRIFRDIIDYIENGMVPTYKATDDIPAEQFKAAWFDADRKVLSEKVVGTADTTISQIWTSEAPLYGMGQQDLDTTMKNIASRSNEAIKEAELY